MQKNFLRLRDLGQNDFWQLVHNSSNISKEQEQIWQSDLKQYPIHLWTANDENAEAKLFLELLQDFDLNITKHDCRKQEFTDVENLVKEFANENKNPILCIGCGFHDVQLLELMRACKKSTVTWFNGYSTNSAPWAALAEVALQVSIAPTIDTWRICWLGRIGALGHSMMEAAIYAPYEFFMGVPPWSDPEFAPTDFALKAGAKIFMSREPRLAMDEASMLYIDTDLEEKAKNMQGTLQNRTIPVLGAYTDFIWENGLNLNEKFLCHCLKDVRILTTQPQQVHPLADAELQTLRANLRKNALLISLQHVI